jgi:hypothetical protein
MDESQSKLPAATRAEKRSMISTVQAPSIVNFVGAREAATKLLTASLATSAASIDVSDETRAAMGSAPELSVGRLGRHRHAARSLAREDAHTSR